MLLLILQLDKWPNKVGRQQHSLCLQSPVYQCIPHSSPRIYGANCLQTPTISFNLQYLDHGSRCTPGSPATYVALNAAILKVCLLLSLFTLDVVCIQPVSIHLSVACLAGFLSIHLVLFSILLFCSDTFPFFSCAIYACLTSLRTLF